jgi:hypothetical protein
MLAAGFSEPQLELERILLGIGLIGLLIVSAARAFLAVRQEGRRIPSDQRKW